MELEHAFGQTIRRLRYEAGLSQEALAHRSGLDRSYLSELENGHKSASIRTLFSLARALEISASELIGAVEKEFEQ